ncbi:hypothetical protein B0O80DRAFT_451460 [Mortierella sp. GBAus27b]|nr:hypothetical protein B0O80DRAFT_451460 [Mortierella sp. GBAus27b]
MTKFGLVLVLLGLYPSVSTVDPSASLCVPEIITSIRQLGGDYSSVKAILWIDEFGVVVGGETDRAGMF